MIRLVALRPPPVADKGSKALSEIMSKRQHIYVQRIATIFQTGELGSLPQIKLDFAIFTCFVIIIRYVLLSAGERDFFLQVIHNIHYIKTFLSNIRLYQARGYYPPQQNCENNCNTTLGHNMFFDITNCLHELGTAARRKITINKKQAVI